MFVPWELYCEVKSLELEIYSGQQTGQRLEAMTMQPTLFDRIIEDQLEDPEIVELIHRVEGNETDAFELREKGELRVEDEWQVVYSKQPQAEK